MDLNAGEIIERVIRRNKISISELARRMQVNRRTVYNWFDQETLKIETICKIGYVLDHDFSVDFPEVFGEHEFAIMETLNDSVDENEHTHPNSVHYWMIKYISLLEKYNELLSQETGRTGIANTPIKRLEKKPFTDHVYEHDPVSLQTS